MNPKYSILKARRSNTAMTVLGYTTATLFALVALAAPSPSPSSTPQTNTNESVEFTANQKAIGDSYQVIANGSAG